MNKKFKLNAFVMDRPRNLFGTVWMESVDSWNMPINTFCNSVKVTPGNSKNFKRVIKSYFPDIFIWRIRNIHKAKATFKLKDNAQPIFKRKRKVSLCSWRNNWKRIGPFRKIRILSKTDYSAWGGEEISIVYVKKEQQNLSFYWLLYWTKWLFKNLQLSIP